MADKPIADSLTFREALGALAQVLRIHPKARDTFRSRVEQIQKSLPGLGGAGRGKKRAYGLEDLVSLATVLDMVSAGLTPQAIAKYLNGSVYLDKSIQLKLDIEAAIRADKPLVIAIQALHHMQYGLSAPVSSIGLPEDPAAFGPFVAVYPAIRERQLQVTLDPESVLALA